MNRRFTNALSAIGLFTLLGACNQGVADLDAEPANQTTPVVESANTTPSPFDAPATNTAETPAADSATPIAPSAFVGEGELADAVAAAASGDLNRAKNRFRDLLDDPELGGYAAYNLGVIAYREGQVSDAEGYFEQALDKQPDLGLPLVALVRMRLRDGDRSGASRLVQSQLAASDNAPQIRAANLYVMLDEQDYEGVIRLGRELLLDDEENLDVFFTMATAYLRTDRASLAEYIVDQALGRDNSRAEFQVLRAQVRIANDNLTGAQTILEQVLQNDPYHAEAHNNLGLVRLRSRNYDRAEESFDNAIRYAPDYAPAWLNLGNARKGQQNYTGAAEAFNQALEVDRNYADPYFNLAVLYLDAEMPGLDRIERLEQSLAYFDAYQSAVGAIPSGSSYSAYRAEAQGLLDTERTLQEQSQQDPFASDGGGDAWGDDGGGDDAWGDDGGDAWGDDGGDDAWGDEGGGDDTWGDDGGDVDWGDDGGGDDTWDDDESSEEGDDTWGDGGDDVDWGDAPADDTSSDDSWDEPW